MSLMRGNEIFPSKPTQCAICEGKTFPAAGSPGEAIPLCPEHYKMHVEATRLSQSQQSVGGKFVQLLSHGPSLYALTEDGSVYLFHVGDGAWVKWHEKRR